MNAAKPAPGTGTGLLPLFGGILRSEARKLHTVRSTWWLLLAGFTFTVATAALLGALLPAHLSVQQKTTIDAVRVSLGGLHLTQITAGLLGVLAITGEYSTGMIRATLTAVPQRRLLLAAKAVILTAAVAATAVAGCLAAYLVFQAFLPAADPLRSTLAAPGAARAVTGAGLYLTVLALLGFGLGAALRSSAAAVAALFGLLFVPTLLTALLPQAWQNRIAGYLPMNAGDAIYTTRSEAHMLAPWTGLAVFSAYAAIALAAGFILINRRDA
jgi:ABC-type transport system involved in multi-copper enzyme maturation permease subunit